MDSSEDDWFVCSHCGAELPGHARFCRYCGADDTSGWNAEEPDPLADDFDYDEFVQREFPEQSPNRPGRRRPFLQLVVVVLLCLTLLWITFAH